MATIASGLNGGGGFGSSDTITQTTLNNHVNSATVTAIANADVASNALIAVTKLATITTSNVLGSLGSGNVSIPIVGNTGILKNDDALGTSDTIGATQGNIKAYADSLIPAYINITSNSSTDITQTDSSTTTHTYPIANFAGGSGLSTSKIRAFFVEITAKVRRTSGDTIADVKATMPDGTDVVLLGQQALSPEDNQQQVRGTVMVPVNSGQTNLVLKPTLSGDTKETTLTIQGCLQYG